MEKRTQLILVNAGCALLAVCFLFFLLFSLQQDAAVLTWILLILFAVVLGVWIYANRNIMKENAVEAAPDLETPEDISRTFSGLLPKAFKEEIRASQQQAARMEQIEKTAASILKDTFGDSQITIAKFSKGISQAEGLFYDNQRAIIRQILLFDEIGYDKARLKGDISAYESQIDRVRSLVEENEQILQKTGALVTDLASVKDTPALEDKSVIRQLDELTSQTEYYKEKVH